MKLSKKSLMNALILATEKTSSFIFAEAQNALQDGTLEIEGYKRIAEEVDIDFSHPDKVRRRIKKFNDNFENSASEL